MSLEIYYESMYVGKVDLEGTDSGFGGDRRAY